MNLIHTLYLEDVLIHFNAMLQVQSHTDTNAQQIYKSKPVMLHLNVKFGSTITGDFSPISLFGGLTLLVDENDFSILKVFKPFMNFIIQFFP